MTTTATHTRAKDDTEGPDSPAEVSKRITQRAQEKQERRDHRAAKKAARAFDDSRRGRLRSRLSPSLRVRKGPWGIPQAVWTGVLRAVIIVVDYLLVSVSATGVIPAIAMWLHEQAGAGAQSLTSDGKIALWIVPLLFVAGLLVIGEAVLIRELWRWGTRRIEAMKAAHPSDEEKAAREAMSVSSAGTATKAASTKTTGAQAPAKKKRKNKRSN